MTTGPDERPCRSCRQAIRFAWTGQASMPVNADPAPTGNVRLTWTSDGIRDVLRAEVLGPLEVELARADDEPLHLAHFATCTDPDRYRKDRR